MRCVKDTQSKFEHSNLRSPPIQPLPEIDLVEGAVVDHDPVHDGYGVHQGRIELVDGLEGLGGVVAHVPVHFAEGAPSGASVVCLAWAESRR